MITETDLIKLAARRFGMPEKQVEHYYKAYVKGLKKAVSESDVLKFSIFKGLELYFTDKISRAEHGKSKPSRTYIKSRQRRMRKVRLHMEHLRRRNTIKVIRSRIAFRRVPPIEYYGYNMGYTLKELEAIQNRMFEKVNTYDYEAHEKAKRDSKIKAHVLERRQTSQLGDKEEEHLQNVPFEFPK